MIKFMHRAFQLAELGRGNVSPNPVVGCVVVYGDEIIGEGWHQKYGESHAEVNAILSVKNKDLLKKSTVFVTLEPCSHFGKTPPCADLLIKHQPKKVVIANLDPNPLVAGKGIEKLRNAGIEVEIGLLEEYGKWQNRCFFTSIEKKRPYIILKWAETADGFIAGIRGKPFQISNTFSKQLLHQWRAEIDAILIGTNTAETDNPQLTVRNWAGKNPLRIVLDRNLRLPKKLHIFDDSVRTVVYNSLIFSNQVRETEHVIIDFDQTIFPQILQDLQKRKIQSLLVEGGTKTLQTLLDSSIFDEIRIFKSNKKLEDGIPSPNLPKGLLLRENENIAGDNLAIYTKNC